MNSRAKATASLEMTIRRADGTVETIYAPVEVSEAQVAQLISDAMTPMTPDSQPCTTQEPDRG
jgi:hypothetical protein